MDYHKSCFFCCKHINDEFPFSSNDKAAEIKLVSHPIDIGFTKRPTTNKSNNQVILQLSHYLKVPRNQTAELKEGNISSALICENCEELTETLSNLCSDMEITKMKISHYLNLLADRIIGINKEDSTEHNKQMQLTQLQEILHQKC